MNVEAITLFVADRLRSKDFYERALDGEPIFEDDNSVVFRLGNLVVNVLADRNAPTLVEPLAVGPRDGGPRALLTLGVDDVDAACDRLRERGVEILNGPVDRPWGVRTAAFADPDGHAWELAAPIG